MAISTYKAFLMYKAADSSTWAKLVDIKDYPDLGGSPELLETTTLSNGVQTFIPGIQQLDSMEFTCNYDHTDYTTVKALEGTEYDFAVWFGGTVSGDTVTPTGSEGKFKWKGKLSVYVNGGGVNEVVDMTITIANSTDITEDTATTVTSGTE